MYDEFRHDAVHKVGSFFQFSVFWMFFNSFSLFQFQHSLSLFVPSHFMKCSICIYVVWLDIATTFFFWPVYSSMLHGILFVNNRVFIMLVTSFPLHLFTYCWRPHLLCLTIRVLSCSWHLLRTYFSISSLIFFPVFHVLFSWLFSSVSALPTPLWKQFRWISMFSFIQVV